MRRRRLESRLVWIFGSPRSGSTWLLNLLAADATVAKLDEPGIGVHLGVSIEGVIGLEGRETERFRFFDARADAPDYFFAHARRSEWAAPLRKLVLARLRAEARGHRWLVIKEPHGSDAADLLMSLLPRSRMIFLLRDGRDVIDSELDAGSEGSWAMERVPGYDPVSDRVGHIERRARTWVRRTRVVERAYAQHPAGLRRLVHYEDLRRDPKPILSELAGWLDLDASALARAADQLAFDRMPDDAKGTGKFVRAATPGLWRQNMTEEEQAVLEATLGAKVSELYPRGA